MTFIPEKVEAFKTLFDSQSHNIRAFKGCQHLELLQEINKSNIFFTYSFWDAPKYLEQYRQSDLFNGVWSATKKLFIAKPEAWSVNQNRIIK